MSGPVEFGVVLRTRHFIRDGTEDRDLSGVLDRAANVRALATDGSRYVVDRLVGSDLSS